MATALSTTYYTDYLYERWLNSGAMQQILRHKAPLLGLIDVDETAGGRHYHVPILKKRPGGRSHTYATALANATGSQADGFDVTYVNNYQVGILEGNVIRQSKGDKNAIIAALDHEVEGAIVNMKKDLRRGFFGNTGGARGVVSSISTVYLTLTNVEDTVNFEIGDEVCAAATDGTSGSLRDSGQAITLVGVNHADGILTADENWSEIASMAADDYVFHEGDFGADVAGLTGWVPQSAPGATAWYGVVRNTNDILGGLRSDGRGKPKADAIMDASGIAEQFDADINLAVCAPTVWTDIAKGLMADQGNRMTSISDNRGIVGYDAIVMYTQQGMCKLVADPSCPKDTIFLLDLSTWKIASVGGPLVQVVDDDGLLIRRSTTADAWLFEILFLGNLCCSAPGRNINLQIA